MSITKLNIFAQALCNVFETIQKVIKKYSGKTFVTRENLQNVELR